MMIWLIGNKGMLGSELERQLRLNGYSYRGTDREVSILDPSAIEAFVQSQKEPFDFIINCSAYTAVDKAESERELAWELNATGPGNIARLAKKIGAVMLHISTDYVFDGAGDSPRTEDMPVAPLGVYGMTKAEGERAVARELSDFYILRTAWLYGWAGRNFVYTMIKAMSSRDSVRVVSDQRGTPTFAGNLAAAILRFIDMSHSGNAAPYGIYHITDEGETTWYDFTLEIQRQALELGLVKDGCKVLPCTTAEYPAAAVRPAYSVLSKKKIQAALGITLPQWQESLSVFLKSSLFELR